MAKKPKRKPNQVSPTPTKAESPSQAVISGSTIPSFFRNTRLQSIVIFLFAFLLYANTLGHQWTQDDTVVITGNMLTQQGVAGIPEIFSKDTFFGYFKIEGKESVVAGGRYRPLTVAMFAIVYQFFGKNPFPFHILTVLLFASVCLLLYQSLLLLLQNFKASGYAALVAWATAILFAAHPIHTEAVANIKGCDEIVTLLFSLGALYLCLKAFDTGKILYHILAGFSLFLGLLAKENAITFLAVIPLALIYFRKSSFNQLLKIGAPLVAAFIAFFVMRMSVLPEIMSRPPMELINNPYIKWENGHWVDFTAGEKYATIFYTLGRYLQLLVFPLMLTHDYYPRHIGIMQWSDPAVIVSFLAYVVLFLFAIRNLIKGKRDVASFGILFYLVTLSIVSNLVIAIGTNMSERFLFMPSIGFCLVIASLLVQIAGSTQKIVFRKLVLPSAVLLIVLVLFSARTILRLPAWHDNRTLAFTDVLTSTNSAKVQSFCGGLCVEEALKEKDPAKKPELFKQSVYYNSNAIEIHPQHKSALLNRGVSYYYLKQYDEAIADLRIVRQIAVDDRKGWINLSLALTGKGKYFEEKQDLDSAFQFFTEAVQTDTTNEEAIWHLGVVTAKLGKYAEAIPWFVKFTQIRPNDPTAWDGLEWAYNLNGETEKAAESRAKSDALKQK
jgi:Tfp pilus assembly protein PilF